MRNISSKRAPTEINIYMHLRIMKQRKRSLRINTNPCR